MADLEMLESILCDFGLFEFHECGNRVLISSVYIGRVMQPFDEKTRRFRPPQTKIRSLQNALFMGCIP